MVKGLGHTLGNVLAAGEHLPSPRCLPWTELAVRDEHTGRLENGEGAEQEAVSAPDEDGNVGDKERLPDGTGGPNYAELPASQHPLDEDRRCGWRIRDGLRDPVDAKRLGHLVNSERTRLRSTPERRR